MAMKKKQVSITNPEELNKNLQYSSPLTWVMLSGVILLIIGFFVWSIVYKIEYKIEGLANIVSGAATLNVTPSSLNKLKVDQKVYISGLEGVIVSFDEDKQPVVTNFDLEDGEYPYYIEIYISPVEFLIDK